MSERKGIMKFAEKLTKEENFIKRNVFYVFITFLCLISVSLLLFIPIAGYEISDKVLYLSALSWINSENMNYIAEDFAALQIACFIIIIVVMLILLLRLFGELITINKVKGKDKKVENMTMLTVVFVVFYTMFSWIFPVINSSFGGDTFAKVNLIPLTVTILVTLYYSIVKGCMGTIRRELFEEEVMDDDEQESREILLSVLNGSRAELFIYSILALIISVASILSNILTVTYELVGSKIKNEISIVGWDLLFGKVELTTKCERFIGYIALVFFIFIIFALFLVLISYLKRSKAFYQISVATIIMGVSITLLIGLLGQYYKIIQAVSLDFISDIVGDTIGSLDNIIKFEVKSSSLLFFFGSCTLLVLLFLRNPYTKSLVLERRIEDENAAKLAQSVEIKGDDRTSNDGNGGNGEVALSTDSLSNDACPTFTELDEKYIVYQMELEERKKELFENPSLPKLIDFIVEYARDSRLHLYYTKEDIATFFAGLGTTKLSILQGMSGTGKTSLPKIVAEALYSVCDIVEVESSWRDKNELLGYYNEFNKIYTPKKFTQALYKAKLNSDVLTFIVLDEMNLSRIEYYFSDFLSLMEHEPDKREIKLVNIKLTKKDEESEYMGLEEGHTLKIPNNVWFIGTANRDESTYDISDKVYDRAYTMNFDKRAAKVQSFNDPINHRFLPADTLNILFDNAKKAIDFTIDDNPIIAAVEKLVEPYNISFGNRIANQMESFVKIYLSCFNITEKSVNEALEIVLLSKVVRKLELKNIEDKDELAQEFANLGLSKCSEFILKLKED